MRVSVFAEVVTKHDIVRALEEGTWAELRVRDWDLTGASSLRAPPRTLLLLMPTGFGSQALQLDPALSRGRGCSQRSRTACRQACA